MADKQIVDIYGNPLRQQTLREPQTAHLTSLIKEYASHPAKGLTPRKLASILKEAEQGNLKSQAELFQDMEERDAHLYAEISKRKRAPISLNWSIEAPKNPTPQEKSDADFLSEILEDQENLEDLFLDLYNGIGYGYAPIELEWKLYGHREWLPAFHYRPQSWFQLAPDNQNELRLRSDNDPNGEILQPFGWIVHKPKALSGYIARTGLFRVLVWPYLFKNYAVTDLAEMLEIYGLPLRIGKYPPGTTDAEKATLLRAVTGLGHSAAGIIPQSMDIEFQQAAQGTSDPFLAMNNWAEASISKAILGGTLTSQTSSSGGGAYSLGEVHNEVRHDLLASDAKQLANTLNNDLLWPLLVLNRPNNNDMRRMPKLRFDVKETEDITKLADALPKLVDVGVNIPIAWVQEKTGIPQPVEDEPILKRQTTSQPALSFLTANLPNNSSALNVVSPMAATQRGLDNALNSVDPELINQQMVNLLKPVLDKFNALGENATSEDFFDILATSYPDLNDEQLRELIACFIFNAEIWGRINGSR